MCHALRILVAQNVPKQRTGGMSRLLGFIHDEVGQDGHTVEYFCADHVPARLSGRWARFSFPLLLRRHVVAAARAGRPFDVLNVHEPSAAAVVLGRRAAGNPRVVVTTHGVEQRAWEVSRMEARLNRAPMSLKTRLTYPLTVLMQSRIGLRGADHIFCLNDEDKDYLENQFAIPPDRVTRIFPAADAAYGTVAAHRDYCSAQQLVFFGTWLARKGSLDIVNAFASLAERHANLRLTVLGAGFPAENVLQAFPLELRPRVSCPSARAPAELAEHLTAADVFILPSLFEGTPLTLVEAMLSGLPVVTTATCGMRDVITDGCNGLLIPIRSPEAIVAAVERLLADAGLRERLGRRAHADAAEKYTWERVAVPVREVYRRIAAAGGAIGCAT
jgi:glycosyltransferase involved in cell wall biosynthesis